MERKRRRKDKKNYSRISASIFSSTLKQFSAIPQTIDSALQILLSIAIEALPSLSK